jgi:hypothetical protein
VPFVILEMTCMRYVTGQKEQIRTKRNQYLSDELVYWDRSTQSLPLA